MMKIEIICGTYGYRPDGSKHPIPIDRGGICEVSEEEAQRLFALRVARPAEEMPSPAVATPPAGEDGSGAGAAARAQRARKAPILTPSSSKR